MNEMQVLFIQAVSFSMAHGYILMGHRIEGTAEEYEKGIDTAIDGMLERKSKGEGFDALQYSIDTLEEIGRSSGADAFRVFAEYCSFQSSILALSEQPTLVQRFHRVGLEEWALLTPDGVTLQPFALEFFNRLVVQFEIDAETDPETAQEIAELLYEIAEVFGFPMTDTLRTKVEFFLDLTAGDFDEYHRGDDLHVLN